MTTVDGIARFSLDPARRVPLIDEATLERLGLAVSTAVTSGTRVFIVTGGTDGVFAAGADLAHLATLTPARARSFSRRGQEILDRLQSETLVTIAVVRGRCIGGAFDLAMACDIRLADSTASFSHPGPRLGFITGYGGTSRLPGLIGPAARAVLSGRRSLDSTEARELGLLADLTPPGALDRVTDELARRIAGVPAERIRVIKDVVRHVAGSPYRRRLERPISRLALRAGDATREA